MPFAFIPFILLIVPIIEIGAFIAIGGQIGIGWTLLMILVTAVIGSLLLRHQGLSLINRVQTEMGEGRVPGQALGEGLMIVIAGILLLTPGFVTDALGFTLFVPPVRQAIWGLLASRITVAGPGGAAFGNGSPFGNRGGESPYNIDPTGDIGGGDRSEGLVIDLDADDYTSGPKNPDSPWNNKNG